MKCCKFLLTALSLAMVSHGANAGTVLAESATPAMAYVTFVPSADFAHTLTAAEILFTAGQELASDTVLAKGAVTSEMFTTPMINSAVLEWVSGEALPSASDKAARVISGMTNPEENKILVQVKADEGIFLQNRPEDYYAGVTGGMFGLVQQSSNTNTLGYKVVLPRGMSVNADSYELGLIAYLVVP